MPATSAGAVGRGEEPSALAIIVDGLIDRAQRSPLMRRPPAQCSPEEQAALAQILADLAALRALRSAVEALPMLRLDQVAVHWPDLGTLLVAARRGAASRPKPRETPPEPSPADTVESALVDNGPEPPPAAEEPVGPTVADAPAAATPASQSDLAHLLLEALTVQGRALNTTQMLTWLEERGMKVARQDITDTLYRHEELFRRRGTSQWVVAGQE